MSLSLKTKHFDGFMIFQPNKAAQNSAVSAQIKRRRLKTGAQPERAAPQNQ
jgi:hypothetical protein